MNEKDLKSFFPLGCTACRFAKGSDCRSPQIALKPHLTFARPVVYTCPCEKWKSANEGLSFLVPAPLKDQDSSEMVTNSFHSPKPGTGC